MEFEIDEQLPFVLNELSIEFDLLGTFEGFFTESFVTLGDFISDLMTRFKRSFFFPFISILLTTSDDLLSFISNIITRTEFYKYYLAEKADAEEKDFKKLDGEITEETEFIDQKKADGIDGPHPPPTKVVIPHKGTAN